MDIGVIGINHKSAALQLREEISKICDRNFGKERNKQGNFPVILLSTCNRTELYFSSENLAESHSFLLNTLRKEFFFPFEHTIYSYFGRDCFFHLATVTSGFDSAIIGETEIQGQVKKAYEEALSSSWLSTELHFLFQKCLKIGKDIRSKTKEHSMMPTLEEAIFQAGTHLLGPLTTKNILLIGFSEINYKIFKNFKKRNLNLTLCNRTLAKISDISDLIHLPWEEFYRWHEFDLIIFGTKSPQYLLTCENCIKILTNRRLLIDLSVPRNVDPKLSRLSGITLLNIDQLMKGIDRKRKIWAEDVARHEKRAIARLVEKQIEIFSVRNTYQPLLRVI